MKLAISGTAGVGKTVLSRALEPLLELEYIAENYEPLIALLQLVGEVRPPGVGPDFSATRRTPHRKGTGCASDSILEGLL